MNTGKYTFAQLIEFLPKRIFDRTVMKYEGNKYVKHFKCWNQFLVMMYGQLSNRDSLRDQTNIVSALSFCPYHHRPLIERLLMGKVPHLQYQVISESDTHA